MPRALAVTSDVTAQRLHDVCGADPGTACRWVLEQTNGRGVDVVVDPLGATWQESIRSLARGGRLVVCGATLGNRPEFDIREVYQRHRSIHGAPMGNWNDFSAVMNLLHGVVDVLLRSSLV